MLDSIPKFNASVKLLRQLRLTSWRLDHCFQRLDSTQHALFTKAAAELKARYPAYGSVADADPSFFHGRSLIFNRATPEHTDRKDMKLAWTPLITVGPYTEGTLHVVGKEIPYLSRTLVFLRGGILKHRVSFSGGQRVSIAHFMHKEQLKEVGVMAVPLVHYQTVVEDLKKGN